MSQEKSVYIAYTGGTIGMERSARGYRPAPGFLAEQMAAMPEFRHPAMPCYVIHEYAPLLDSANMTPDHWARIGADLVAHYDEHDGFIVLHGTDTMAFSASALSFMFDNLAKPVIFTGSQIPLTEVRNDARDNLITSLLVAAHCAVPEVCLFFGDRLLRGNRATKVSAVDFRAFDSPNFPHLGHAGVKLEIHHDLLLQPSPAPLRFNRVAAQQVADLRFFPGMSADAVERFLAPPLAGAVLHTYGVGNAPDHPALLAALRRATERGVVLVNCTQCLEGTVNMNDYATGKALRDAGVRSGYDMTPEAALTKLSYLLSLGLESTEVERRVEHSLRGELTPDADRPRAVR